MLKAIRGTAVVLSLTLGISGFLPIANIANHSAYALLFFVRFIFFSKYIQM
ncbi:hypothetical protein P4H94_06045 [Paenibacillus macerans]|uniref:hypothetical protein n=1 Tax=Paenibacillus macerans TaxID=44252 RepID=UPI000B03C9F4|nr:hypothetical protein [Paenibacillus macerans]MCY7560205.1 hypothetical protein [Paenibacillus macerans]MEC0136446.1 hypothetical protein [Paenibacillus macerans]MEC0151259.1 hypothetical protein [Paenibacillus macerans]